MISAAEARAITNDSDNRMKAKEKVEKLSPWIKQQALKGKDYLLFIIEHLELEDFMVQEFKDLGYEIVRLKFQQDGYPIYEIRW